MKKRRKKTKTTKPKPTLSLAADLKEKDVYRTDWESFWRSVKNL